MSKLYRIVQGGFAGIFTLTIISVYIRGIKHLHLAVTTEILITLAAVALMFLLSLFYRKLKNNVSSLDNRQTDRIFLGIVLGMLAVQLVFAFVLHAPPSSDLGYVDKMARNFAENWNTSHIYDELPKRHFNYLVRYPNNQALFVMLSLVYRGCYLLTGRMPYIVPVLLNTFALNLSAVLLYFIAKKIFRNNAAALFSGILSAGFSVFYTYTSFYYTDSVSMPFTLGSILLFLSGIESKKKIRSATELISSGLLLIAGYKIKGSVIILIPVFLLYLVVFTKKFNILKHIKQFSLVITGCIVMSLLSGAFIGSFNLDSKELSNEIEFPPTHWVMMGLRDRGGFSIDDFWFTIHSGDYDQKKAANIEEIKNRVSDYGFAGMTEHIAKKVSWTWGDGTYFINYYLHKGPKSALRSFLGSDVFKIYCSIYQLMMLFSILISFIKGAVSKRQTREIFMRILICGVYFFFIIWETRSRYLVNFSPVFILITASVIRDMSARLFKSQSHTEAQNETLKHIA